MILQVNKIKKLSTPRKPIYEDYIDISSVCQLNDGVYAKAKSYEIFLPYSKEFNRLDGTYSIDNIMFNIDSVYLLDDTGKTIKKLM